MHHDDNGMRPVSTALDDIMKRIAARVSPEEFARREVMLREIQSSHERNRLIHKIKTRGIPSEDNVRRAIQLEQTPRTAPLDKILTALQWRAARRLPTGERPGLVIVLAGGNGSGKTVGCSWVVARAVGSSLFLTANELGEFPDHDYSTYVEMREQWKSVGTLIIDDVGAEKSEKGSRRVVERVGPLLLDRFNNGRATIVTTNRPAGEFAEIYLSTEESTVDEGVRVAGNARLASRLSDGQMREGCPYWYEFRRAPSYRGPEGLARLARLPTVHGDAITGLA